MIPDVFLAAFVIMAASLSGVLFIHRVAREFLERRLAYLVSFSAGVFLVTAAVLALEALELFVNPLVALGWVMAGYGGAWVAHILLPETHHHHDTDCEHGHRGAKRLLIGDAIHNAADGLILVAAFAASPVLGIAVTVSVFIHEALQEVSEFFVLRQSGFSTKAALLTNAAISSTILIGVGLGLLLAQTIAIEGVLLALSAGFFLNVVIHDLLPTRTHHRDNKTLLWHVLLLTVGVLLMVGVNSLLAESHSHGTGEAGDHDHHDDHEHDVEHQTEQLHEAEDHHDHDDDHADEEVHHDHGHEDIHHD